jgi:hypothetical protein
MRAAVALLLVACEAASPPPSEPRVEPTEVRSMISVEEAPVVEPPPPVTPVPPAAPPKPKAAPAPSKTDKPKKGGDMDILLKR